MKKNLKILIAQTEVEWLNPERNIEKMLGCIKKEASSQQIDLIVFPELVLTGNVVWNDKEFRETFFRKAETIPGVATETLGKVAREFQLSLVFGMCEKHNEIPGMIFNSGVLIGSDGQVLGIQRKIHIPGEERHFFAPDHQIKVFKTEMANIGIVICYDASFPEIPRILSLKGAEVICGLFNVQKKPERSPNRLHYLAAARANENMNFFICCNRVGDQGDKVYLGHSAVAGPPGEILAFSEKESEEMIPVILNGDLIIKERGERPIFRDRRPELYSKICEL